MQILTPQMIRDHLTFSGPLSLGEIVAVTKSEAEERSNILVMLNILQDRGEAVLDADKGVWRSLVVLN